MLYRVKEISWTIIITLFTILVSPSDSKILVTNRGNKELVDIFQDKMLFNPGKINWADKSVKNYLIHADPPNACYDVKPPPTAQFETTGRDSAKIVSAQVKWILLASDSDCGLIEKEMYAKKVGFSAIIIYNDRTNAPEMMAHTQFLKIKNPLDVSFVGENDGHILKHDYAHPRRYTITFEENAEKVRKKSYNPPRTQFKSTQKQSDTMGICSGLSFKACIWEIVEIVVLMIGLLACFLPFLLGANAVIRHGISCFLRTDPPQRPINSNAVPNLSNIESRLRADIDRATRFENNNRGDNRVIDQGLIIRRVVPLRINPFLLTRVPELESFTFKIDEDLYYKQCVICLEDFNDSEELSKLPCTHYFHGTCFGEWFRTSTSQDCPLCRTAVSGTNHDEESRRLLSEFQIYLQQRQGRPFRN